MKNIYSILLCTALLTLVCIGCAPDEPIPVQVKSDVSLTVGSPLTDLSASLSDLQGKLINQRTGKSTDILFEGTSMSKTLSLFHGVYNIELRCLLRYTDKKGLKNEVPLTLSDVIAVKGKTSKSLRFNFIPSTQSFLIEEIFYAGTLTPQSKQYDDDKYIKITNNSSQTLYADGLALLVSMFTSEEKKNNLTPDIRPSAMPVSMVMTLPSSGDGNRYPVLPGASIIICQTAIDHTQYNKNSFSLADANFEWLSDRGYTEGEIKENPKVPNMTLVFATGNNPVWSMNNQGYSSYAIAKLPEDFSAKLSDYTYEWTEDLIVEGTVIPGLKGETCLKIPNEWIIDAVNLCTTTDFAWLPISSTLDDSYAAISDHSGDLNRFGRSVQRKVESTTPTGRQLFMDTNSSRTDFITTNQPSLKK